MTTSPTAPGARILSEAAWELLRRGSLGRTPKFNDVRITPRIVTGHRFRWEGTA